jgi:23S rRNA (guanine745-N1)-methyltransferase
VPSAVPDALARVATLLRCPRCREPLAPGAGSLACPRGHAYDVARHGYVSLLPPGQRPAAGDDAAMVAARAAVLEARHFGALTDALAETATSVVTAEDPLVLDVGAGTGHHLAGVLDALPGARGVALDASRPALRRAARAHPRTAAVAADAWRQIPLRDASVDLALDVFAPRNAAELRRVVRPGGAVVVVTPLPEHLRELAPLHRIGHDPRKGARLDRTFTPRFAPAGAERLSWTLALTRQEAAALLGMGPAARHLRPDFERHLAALPELVEVSAAVELRVFRRPLARAGRRPVRSS